jgi:septin family protein
MDCSYEALTNGAAIMETRKLGKTLLPIATKHNFCLKSPANTTALPFVFVMGSSSSGKSSFINHVLNREIQTTFDSEKSNDQGFTIIAPGEVESDITGQALVKDEDLGFAGSLCVLLASLKVVLR